MKKHSIVVAGLLALASPALAAVIYPGGGGSGGSVSFTNLTLLTNIVESVAVTASTATNIAAYQTILRNLAVDTTLPNQLNRYKALGLSILSDRLRTCTNFVFYSPLANTNTPDTTLMGHITNSPMNTLLFLSNGVYNCGTQDLVMSRRLMILGQSYSNAVIYFCTNGAGIGITEGGTIANASVAPKMSTAWYTRPIFGSDAYADGTNRYLINLNVIGDTDGPRFVTGSNAQQVAILNSYIETRWDGLMFEGTNTQSSIWLYNTWHTNSDTTLHPDFSGATLGTRINSGRLFAQHCRFDSIANGQLENYAFLASAGGGLQSAEFYDCEFNAANPGGDNYELFKGIASATVNVTDGLYRTNLFGGVITASWIPGKWAGYFAGDGASLTNIPNSAIVVGAQTLFRTNAPVGDGTYTNSNSGGASNVYVGPAYLAISNGTASFINMLKSPATPRIMVGGNQGATTTINTNSIAGTNGSGFFVHDSSGNSTNNGNIQSATLNTTGAASFAGLVTGQNGAQISGSGNSVSYRVNNSAREVYLGGTSEGSGWAVKASGTSSKYAATIPALSWLPPDAGVDIGSPTNVVRNVFVTNLFSTTVTATNGLFLPQLSGIPSSVDLRSSSGNTNWLALNLGGDVALIKTNPAAASSYLTNWLTVQLNFVEGSTAGTSVSLTTATAANITSVALTPGTWDLTASIYFDFVGATVTLIEGAFNTTSATIPGPPPEDVAAASPNVTVVSSDESLTIPRRRVTITANTTYYLVGRAAFSAGSIDAYGKILATRVN